MVLVLTFHQQKEMWLLRKYNEKQLKQVRQQPEMSKAMTVERLRQQT